MCTSNTFIDFCTYSSMSVVSIKHLSAKFREYSTFSTKDGNKQTERSRESIFYAKWKLVESHEEKTARKLYSKCSVSPNANVLFSFFFFMFEKCLIFRFINAYCLLVELCFFSVVLPNGPVAKKRVKIVVGHQFLNGLH